jgi:hypothetical protein
MWRICRGNRILCFRNTKPTDINHTWLWKAW